MFLSIPFQTGLQGQLSAAVEKEFLEAIDWLVGKGVSGITGVRADGTDKAEERKVHKGLTNQIRPSAAPGFAPAASSGHLWLQARLERPYEFAMSF